MYKISGIGDLVLLEVCLVYIGAKSYTSCIIGDLVLSEVCLVYLGAKSFTSCIIGDLILSEVCLLYIRRMPWGPNRLFVLLKDI